MFNPFEGALMKPKIKETDSIEFITDEPSLFFFDHDNKSKFTKLSDEYVKEKLLISAGMFGYPVKDVQIVNGKTYYELWIECRIDEEKDVVNKHDAVLCRMVYVEAKDIKFGWENRHLQREWTF